MTSTTPQADNLEAAVERLPAVHDLKTWPLAYDAIYAGLKPWEFRRNDRDYRVGDTLRLLRWSPDDGVYTGEEMRREVVWMLDGGQFGIPEGYCIMSLSSSNARAVAAEEAETGWLIESDVNGPMYHRAGGDVTRNAAEALRFSRQQDAEAFVRAYGPNQYDSVLTPAWRAVEHRWG